MTQSAEAKLNDLRDKTDRQLVSLICHKLDRGLESARVLGGKHLAENALSEASAWMTLLDGVSQLDRRRLEFKLIQLRTAIEHARASGMRVRAAC